jgi:hypothetical protein
LAAESARRDTHDDSTILGMAFIRRAALVMVVLPLAGCAMGGVSIEKAVPDSSTITGSVKPAQKTETDTGKL